MNPTLLVILVRQLIHDEIDYLIVGGVAKILYQEKQYTKDIDVLVRMSNGNYDNTITSPNLPPIPTKRL